MNNQHEGPRPRRGHRLMFMLPCWKMGMPARNSLTIILPIGMPCNRESYKCDRRTIRWGFYAYR